MPNYHQHETDTLTYPIHTRIFEDFLGLHDFITEINPESTVFKKGELTIEVPHLKMLSKTQVIHLLSTSDFTIDDFEGYYEHVLTMREFDRLIDLSGGTLKKDNTGRR